MIIEKIYICIFIVHFIPHMLGKVKRYVLSVSYRTNKWTSQFVCQRESPKVPNAHKYEEKIFAWKNR